MNKPSSESQKIQPHISQFTYIRKALMKRGVVVAGLMIIFITIIVAIFAPLIAPYSPDVINLRETLAPPSTTHLFGTDQMGRDLFSRIIYGARISLLVGIVGVAMAGGCGIMLGLIAGYFGGWINMIIMRSVDTFMAIPPLVLVLAIAAILGGGIYNVLIAIGIGMFPTYTRLMCGQVIALRQSDFITAAESMGAKVSRVMFRHLLPNAFPSIMVLLTINLGVAILMEAALSFLGIGILPPTTAWGSMVNDGQRYLLTNPQLTIIPGMAILVVVLSFNMVGDGLRDALDPRLRGTL